MPSKSLSINFEILLILKQKSVWSTISFGVCCTWYSGGWYSAIWSSLQRGRLCRNWQKRRYPQLICTRPPIFQFRPLTSVCRPNIPSLPYCYLDYWFPTQYYLPHYLYYLRLLVEIPWCLLTSAFVPSALRTNKCDGRRDGKGDSRFRMSTFFLQL